MINSVQSGDQLLTISQSKIISTDMIMMLDKHTLNEGIYIYIRMIRQNLKKENFFSFVLYIDNRIWT